MPPTLDEIDKRILRVLQRDGRTQNNDLAKAVGLSPSPCLRRVRLLEEAGVIDRYVAVLNPAKIGKGLTFFTRIWLKTQDEDTIEHFVAEVDEAPRGAGVLPDARATATPWCESSRPISTSTAGFNPSI